MTCPVRFQTSYSPFEKLEIVRVSSTALLVASSTSIRSARACVVPIEEVKRHLVRLSVREIHVDTHVCEVVYQTEATRSSSRGFLQTPDIAAG